MKLVVVGGSGFIGTYLVGELLESGHEVSILDRRPSSTYSQLVTLGDVRNAAEVEAALRGADAVYLLAALHRDDVRPVSKYYEVNVGGAENVTRAAERNGIRTLVFTSSVAVYGFADHPADEQTPPRPFNDYGKSKLLAEEVLKSWARRRLDRSLVVVRPTVVFGEGNRGNVYNLIQAVSRPGFVMVGSGHNKKSVCYVRNLVKLLVDCLDFSGPIRILNYADKPDLSVRELVELIQAELGRPNGYVPRIPYSVGLLGGFLFDGLSRVTGRDYAVSSVRVKKFSANTQVSTCALEETGFRVPFTIQEGLRRMIASNYFSAKSLGTRRRNEAQVEHTRP